ncbi:MAG: DUF4838 domain-containing protein [Pirellulaceae bacterium]|nr:DUF4838 domain-containing protein [Pirellulaceae bacterium]
MKYILLSLLCSLCIIAVPAHSADTIIVDGGQPRAEIIIGKERPRMVTLAALELQHFVEQMSGARLPIVTAPTAAKTVKIHVGRSAETDRLGVKTDGLRDGAYRMVSGADWLVLIGLDFDFDPSTMPWPKKRNESPKAAAEWEKFTEGKTDAAWGFPFASGFKGFWNPADFNAVMSTYYDADFAMLWNPKGGVKPGFWNQDEGGSLNAVYGLLRGLGVRWFMAGDLGEVVPKMATISVGPFNETVKPDFPLRMWQWNNYASFGFDDIIWARRLGMNSGYELLGPLRGPHGLNNVYNHEAIQKAHPDYFAILNGKRDTEKRASGKDAAPCFTSEGLIKETVKYISYLYDTFHFPSVDIWPVDGLQLCQCENCSGKSASELVWGFADRVAREVYKKYPDNRITCGAYTSYIEAPDTIEKFSPNLAVWIANAGRPMMEDAEHWTAYWARVQKWQSKIAPGNILRLENNRYHIWGQGAPIAYPVLHPRSVAKDLKALKGISLGDNGEQSQEGGKWRAPGLEHITLYVESRFLWDADQDVDAVLDDYCALYYGPAAKAMKEAITFAELNLAHKDQSRGRGKGSPANVPLATNLRFRELLDTAQQIAGNTVYGKRIALMISELQPKDELIATYREKEKVLAEARAKAPVAIAGTDLTMATAYTLKDNMTLEAPPVETTFRAGWDNNAILFDIVCQEPEMKRLNVSPEVHNGDNVVISLETPMHSYYHIEINPDGVIAEGNPAGKWQSRAEVKTERGSDSWRVWIRIPVVGALEAQSDPNHRISGSKPTAQEPWYFNVGRLRVLDFKKPELQAFSTTRAGWHVPEKFGRLETR